MNKTLLKYSIFAVFLSLLVVPSLVSAIDAPLPPTGINLPSSDTPETAIVDAIINVINIILGLLGLIAVIIIIYGGFKYMASGGDSEKTKNARKLLIAGLIGLVIIVFAYLIAGWVLTTLYTI